MTIIFNLFSLGVGIVSLVSSIRFYFKYQQLKLETMRNYSLASFFAFLAFVILALPQLTLFNPFWIQIDFILVDIFLLGSVLSWGLAILELAGLSFYKRIFFLIIFSWTLIYIFLNIIFFSQSVPLLSEGKIYYWISGTIWLQSMARALLILGALMITLFYFKWMKTLKEKILFWRTFVFGLGALLTAIAGVIFWFFPFFYFLPFLLILSGCIGFVGFFLSFVVSAYILRP